jgi:hypothetical protein
MFPACSDFSWSLISVSLLATVFPSSIFDVSPCVTCLVYFTTASTEIKEKLQESQRVIDEACAISMTHQFDRCAHDRAPVNANDETTKRGNLASISENTYGSDDTYPRSL